MKPLDIYHNVSSNWFLLITLELIASKWIDSSNRDTWNCQNWFLYCNLVDFISVYLTTNKYTTSSFYRNEFIPWECYLKQDPIGCHLRLQRTKVECTRKRCLKQLTEALKRPLASRFNAIHVLVFVTLDKIFKLSKVCFFNWSCLAIECLVFVFLQISLEGLNFVSFLLRVLPSKTVFM